MDPCKGAVIIGKNKKGDTTVEVKPSKSGAAAGAKVAGPVGAAVGGVIGGALGLIFGPED